MCFFHILLKIALFPKFSMFYSPYEKQKHNSGIPVQALRTPASIRKLSVRLVSRAYTSVEQIWIS